MTDEERIRQLPLPEGMCWEFEKKFDGRGFAGVRDIDQKKGHRWWHWYIHGTAIRAHDPEQTLDRLITTHTNDYDAACLMSAKLMLGLYE